MNLSSSILDEKVLKYYRACYILIKLKIKIFNFYITYRCDKPNFLKSKGIINTEIRMMAKGGCPWLGSRGDVRWK